MNSLTLKVLFTCCTVILATCSKKRSDDPQDSDQMLLADDGLGSGHQLSFRSVDEVNRILRSRLVEDQEFNLLNLLIRFEDSFFSVLIGSDTRKDVGSLMGAYQGLGSRVASESLRASTVHSLLWGLALQDLAHEVANTCGGTSERLALKAEASARVKKVCDSDALDPTSIKALWDLLLRRDVNDDEFARWFAETQGALSQVKGAERIQLAVYEMLFGPEFLIGR